MSRVGPLIVVILLGALLLGAVPADARPVGFQSHLAPHSLDFEARDVEVGETYVAYLTGRAVCALDPRPGGSEEHLDMSERIFASVTTNHDALRATLKESEIQVVYSHDGCVFSNHLILFEFALEYVLTEALPSTESLRVEVHVEGEWGSGFNQTFQVVPAQGGALDVTVPSAITLDSGGNGVALVHVQNQANAPLRLRFEPTVRGAIASQPHGGEQVLEPGEELTREFRFRIQDDQATDATLELIVHQALAHEPETLLRPIVKHIPIEIGGEPATLSAKIEESPAPVGVLPLVILAALAVLRRRS